MSEDTTPEHRHLLTPEARAKMIKQMQELFRQPVQKVFDSICEDLDRQRLASHDRMLELPHDERVAIGYDFTVWENLAARADENVGELVDAMLKAAFNKGFDAARRFPEVQ